MLFTRRRDDGTWCFPAGAADEGGSFATTAITELAQEAGVKAAEENLIAFGCLSRSDLHVLAYPNGDRTHCWAIYPNFGVMPTPRLMSALQAGIGQLTSA